jgi:DNA-binding response OmpR family regulator
MSILILEDDAALCKGMELALKAPGRDFLLCHSVASAKTQLQNGEPVIIGHDKKLLQTGG